MPDNERGPTYGVENLDETFDMAVEVGESSFDCLCTIVGLDQDKGGERKTTDDGRSFTTKPQVILTYSVDEDIGETDPKPTGPIFLSLTPKKGGSYMVNANSKAGVFMEALAAQGISTDPEAAIFTYSSWKDFLGLKVRLQMKEVSQPRRPREKWLLMLPVSVHGWDNEVRAASDLESIEVDVPEWAPEEALEEVEA